MDAVVRYTLAQPGNEQVRSVNAVVGETNDGSMNDIRGLHVSTAHVLNAIARASEGVPEEGSVGAGTGTMAFGWKGGIGTASRIVPGGYVVGVLVQTNYGGNLTIAGAPIYRLLQPTSRAAADSSGAEQHLRAGDGSCMIIVATDAAIDARDLRRLAARAVFGLGRTGSSYSNGSGDFAVAFTTSTDMRSRSGDAQATVRRVLPPDAMSPLFQAALEATEEAVYNSLLRATTVRSRTGTADAIPIDRLRELLSKSQ